ncbi:MAG: DUF6261 family protein [Dysgonamonadaceae bacterium]|jgi:hypothetical protein|nr:DUF6261 family protein [Dysgonamonadaceae bacterium]
MKIKRIKLNYLRNEEWFNFFTEFKSFVQQATPGALNIEALFTAFVALYAQADESLEILRKSSYTAEIVHLDSLRDRTYRGLVEIVRSGLHHYSETHAAAAERIKPLFDHYGDLSGKSYNEETAGIYNLLQELRGQYAPQVATLALEGWINELERNNQAFESAILARNAESADKTTDVILLDIRRKTDRCYLDIVERIEALMLIHGEAYFAVFVKTLNTNIERYLNVLSRRCGHGNKAETKTEE